MNQLANQHILVTGGAGFIGSHLTEALLGAGAQVTVVDNLASGRRQNLPPHPRLHLLTQDICHCRPQDFDVPIHAMVHLAATPSVATSWQSPLASHDQNLSATVAVIQLCQTLSVPRLVFASSAAVYGNPQYQPMGEDHPTRPISPYGLQKLVSEQYAQLFAPQVGFAFVGLRFFNVFGPRQDPSSPYSGVISLFTQAMAQQQSLTLYGDGSQTRDFVYVKDVAIALTQALRCPLEPGASLICNVGTGQAISLLTLIDELQRCFPLWQAHIQLAPSRLGDIQHSQANIHRAQTQLGFRPRWSIATGLQAWLADASCS